MLEFVRRLYYGSNCGHLVLGFPRKLYHMYRFRLVPEEPFIKQHFKRIFGHVPNLRDPKTLNEKIQWLKLHDRTPLQTQCADKYAVRRYVTEKIGAEYLVPLFYSTEDPSDIVPENLPNTPFIVKATHGSSGGAMVKDKSEIDWKTLRKSLRKLLCQNYYYESKEWPYKNIKPRIVVEELLSDENGNIPFDYKIHCFNGQPRIIHVDLDRFTGHKRNLYDTQWNLLPFTWCEWGDGKPLWPNGRDVRRPVQLEQMLEIAQALSSEFLYARIDLYEISGRLYFGEITFHHGSGTEIFTPSEWDRKLGDMLKLPHECLGVSRESGRDYDR